MAFTRSVYGMWSVDPAKHSPIEDVQGIVTGSIVSALGFYILNKVGLLTGGTAGVSRFLSITPSASALACLFFLVNLPFYYLSFRRLGLAFSVKTFISIGLVSVLTELESRWMVIDSVNPLWAPFSAGFSSVTVFLRFTATVPAWAASAFWPSTSRIVSASVPV